jgi:hypothetical protein
MTRPYNIHYRLVWVSPKAYRAVTEASRNRIPGYFDPRDRSDVDCVGYFTVPPEMTGHWRPGLKPISGP